MTDAGYHEARTLLFVPASRPDRFGKAAASGADAVIIDLEDAVAPREKSLARAAAAQHVSGGPGAYVRVNAFGTPWHEEDLAALRGATSLAGVVLPKAESAEHVASVASVLGDVPVLALLETARGVRDASVLADLPQVARLLFGNVDFSLDLGLNPGGGSREALLFARSRIVVASRAAGLPGPADGVQPLLDDDGATAAEARYAASLGFTGKLCLHPRQVAPTRNAFLPSAEERDWAARVLALAGDTEGAAVRVDGEMVDKPRLELARQLLARSRHHGGHRPAAAHQD